MIRLRNGGLFLSTMSNTSPSPAKSRKRRRRWTFISPTGEVIRTSSLKQFADKYGLRHSNVQSLACGHFSTLKGFCSTHPKVKKRRERVTTVLHDTKSEQDYVLGANMKTFAKAHNICYNDLSKLLTGRRIACKGYVLRKTWEMTQIDTAEYSS